jgi:poly-gamma-glutamate capsule biosynthesis protein CapA/YwtB (metallophosphatase superfamily)
MAEAWAPALIAAGGLKLGLLAVTDNEPPFAAAPERPGTAYVDLAHPGKALQALAAGVDSARKAGAKLIVLSCHFGPNMVLRPSKPIRDFRHAAAACGVDLVYGHSAHVPQGVERFGRALILHDTGDFLDDYAVDPVLRNDWSFLFLLAIEDGVVRRLTLIPVALGLAQVRRASLSERDEICRRMLALSEEFGTNFQPCPEGLTLDVRS